MIFLSLFLKYQILDSLTLTMLQNAVFSFGLPVFLFSGLALAQLTTRQCSANSTVIASRCSSTSTLTAVTTCTNFCATTSQSSTALYSKFCSSPSSCVVGSACNIESCNIDISGPASVEVPCGYGLTNIDGAQLTLTNGCSTSTANNYVTADLFYSSNNDGRHLIAVDPTTGAISRVVDPVPTENITQMYQFTFSSLPNLEVSKSINVTFHFGSCVLGLVGPSSAAVCPGYPPGSPSDPTGRTYNPYPQLTYYATNVPPLMPVIFDLASDATPVAGDGAPTCSVDPCAAGKNWGVYSPAVLGGDDPNVFISSMNTYANSPTTSTVGLYGAGRNVDLPCPTQTTPNPTITIDPNTGAVTGSCCQDLLFSVSPGYQDTPYLTGTKTVHVCYRDSSCVIQ